MSIKEHIIRMHNDIFTQKQTNNEQSAKDEKWITFTHSGSYILFTKL
jgi:hypothetical protein